MQMTANRCGMSFQTYQPIEAGKTNVTMTTIARLADGLGIDPCVLVMPVRATQIANVVEGSADENE